VTAAGRVYVADSQQNSSGNGRVSYFDPPYSNGMNATGFLNYNFRQPTGLEFDISGGLWVSDRVNNQILLFSDPNTVVGPVINKWALALIERRVEEALSLGARVVAGGTAEPPCYPPTVLVDVPDSAELAQVETFGPVVILESVESAEQAIRRANESDFGLAASILTGDPYRGLELAATLDAGIVHVNDQPVNDEPQMPFGGMKDSGWGRFGIGLAAEDFTELQWLTSRSQPRTFPF
jgi:acyl-CoA reductase-like NAD-dependent aldehyde dehydrogenase